MSQRREILKQCLSDNISRVICKLSDDGIETLEEIRIRTGRGVAFKGYDALCKVIPTAEDVRQILMRMSDFSVYAHMEQLCRGFITLKGGHRVGIVGRCVTHNDAIENITEISSVCIRLAKQIMGVADVIMDVAERGNVLIVSPPGCGKTTMLRDLARQLGRKENVSLIDERCEIAACVDGVPQLDVGQRTDVISQLVKGKAIPLVVRSMSPEVIMMDELSGSDDIDCITEACSMGVRVIATAHGCDLNDIKKRINTEVFNKVVILNKDKKVMEVV